MTTIAPTPTPTARELEEFVDPTLPVTRRRIDRILIGLGTAFTAVLVVAGALLTWGNNFAENYVADELGSQEIFFPAADSLSDQGREDLVRFAEMKVTTGEQAEAYASYIGGHLEGIGDGMTYAEIGTPQRAARAAVAEAVENGASEEEVAALQAEVDELTDTRETLFKGEMLRGALLNAYAWSTMGRIAGIAAAVAFAGAAVMAALVVAGLAHYRKMAAIPR